MPGLVDLGQQDELGHNLRSERISKCQPAKGNEMKAEKKAVSQLCLLASVVVVLAACRSEALGDSPRLSVPFTSDISINEIMVAQIDHAADRIWEATDPAFAASDVDWEDVEHHAIQIISSRAAMTMGGTGVNDAMWVVQRSWRDYVDQMNAAGLLALRSARAADRMQLARAGEALVATCNGCHQQFKPSIPTEGYRARL